MGAPLFTETIVYVEVVNIIGTMIWYLLGGFSSRIGDFFIFTGTFHKVSFFLFLQHTRNADYGIYPHCTCFLCKYVEIHGCRPIHCYLLKPNQNQQVVFKHFFRNMYQDHGSSVNACRAVSLEPTQYIGHLRVSVWFFFPS